MSALTYSYEEGKNALALYFEPLRWLLRAGTANRAKSSTEPGAREVVTLTSALVRSLGDREKERQLREAWLKARTSALSSKAAGDELEMLQDVVAKISWFEEEVNSNFSQEQQQLKAAASEFAVAIFEDDRDQLANVLAADVLRRLGFCVLNARSDDHLVVQGEFVLDSHFRLEKADLVIVGQKVTEELLRRYLDEVYRWGSPKLLLVRDIGQSVSEVSSAFSFALSGYPEELVHLIVAQIWLSLKFWQARSEQRRRLSAPRPGTHDRQWSPSTE